MTDKQIKGLVARFVDILKPHMSEDEALERANNLAQVFILNRTGFTEEIEVMIIPNSAKAGIENAVIRKSVIDELLKVNK